MSNLKDALHIPDTQSARDERHLAIQRVGVIRERLLHQDREQGRQPGEPQLVQWWNWPNWGNWGNWPNWGNFWRNW